MGEAWKRALLAWNVVAPFASLMALRQGQPLGGLALIASAHWPWLYATLMPRCQWWGPQTRELRGDAVWLTIDDGPDPEDTPRLLDLLEAAGARATFFVIGDKVRRYPDLARAVVERGHQLGNHTMTHPSGRFWAYPRRAVEREVAGCQQVIREAAGVEPVWFRAPAGLRNHTVHPVLATHGLRLAGWSARGFDGVSTDARRVVGRLRPGVRPGAVVLLHEGKRARDGSRPAGEILQNVLAIMMSRGLKTALPDEGEPAAQGSRHLPMDA